MASTQILAPTVHQQPSLSTVMSPMYAPQSAFDAQPSKTGGYFAFARVEGELSLVQVSYATPASALTAVDVKVFRHEFITIFRFTENRTLHPADIAIVEPIDDRLTRYEEENGTVFLARDLMERMRKLSDPRRSMGMGTGRTRYTQVQRQRQW